VPTEEERGENENKKPKSKKEEEISTEDLLLEEWRREVCKVPGRDAHSRFLYMGLLARRTFDQR
jgi:hypothetical protein